VALAYVFGGTIVPGKYPRVLGHVAELDPAGPVAPVAPAGPMSDVQLPGHAPDALGPYKQVAALSR